MFRHTHDISDITRPARGGSVLPKVVGIVLAIGLVRIALAGRSHARAIGHAGRGPGVRWGGRSQAIAAFHRELHRRVDGTATAADATVDADR